MSARVLVVDDVEVNVKLLEAKLAAEYFTVLTAPHGRAALEIAARELPDIVLLDVMMPQMDGFEVCRRLKADARTKSVPIIALTAHAMRGDEERARAAGCDHYLAKPISPKKVVDEVRKILKME